MSVLATAEGKFVSDAAPADTDLEKLKAFAARLDDLFELPLPDAPGYAFVGGRFSVKGGPNGEPQGFSVGAADPDRQVAFRRCVGEAAETMAQFLTLRPDRRIDAAGQPEGLDETSFGLLETLAGADAARAGWIRATRLSDGAASSLPAALCFRDAAARSVAGLSLGCAAGKSIEAATLSALFELIERDAVALWWSGGAPAARLSGIGIDRALARVVEAMRCGAATRRTWFLDLTTDIGVPVVAALSCDDRGRDLAAGFASRGAIEAAASAALRELAQMELGNRLVSARVAHGGLDGLAEPERRQFERMTLLQSTDGRLSGVESSRTHARLDDAGEARMAVALVARLAAAGVEAHIVDLTNPAFGIPAVKVVAPLLQSGPSGAVTPRLAQARKSNGYDADKVPTIGIF